MTAHWAAVYRGKYGSETFLGPKKSRFSGPTPSNAPSNDVAPLKIITYRAIKTTGTLVVLCTRVLLCSVVVCCCVLWCVVVCCCVLLCVRGVGGSPWPAFKSRPTQFCVTGSEDRVLWWVRVPSRVLSVGGIVVSIAAFKAVNPGSMPGWHSFVLQVRVIRSSSPIQCP
jgi:hypothetical protein